jgi:hypothetical protein
LGHAATKWGTGSWKIFKIRMRVRMPNSKHVAIAADILRRLPSQEAEVVMRYYHEAQSEDQIKEATGFTAGQQLEIRKRARIEFLTRIRGESLKP